MYILIATCLQWLPHWTVQNQSILFKRNPRAIHQISPHTEISFTLSLTCYPAFRYTFLITRSSSPYLGSDAFVRKTFLVQQLHSQVRDLGMQLGFGITMNLLVIPGSNHWTCHFCSFHASELLGLQGRLQLHLHSLGAVLLPPSTESRWSHLAGLVLRQGTQCCVNARMLSLTNSALLSAQIFSLGLGHPQLPPGPAAQLLGSGVR